MTDISKKDLKEVILDGEWDTLIDQADTDDNVRIVETASGPSPIRKILNNIFRTFMWITFLVLLIRYYTVNPSIYHKAWSGIWSGMWNLYTYTKNLITWNKTDVDVVEPKAVDTQTDEVLLQDDTPIIEDDTVAVEDSQIVDDVVEDVEIEEIQIWSQEWSDEVEVKRNTQWTVDVQKTTDTRDEDILDEDINIEQEEISDESEETDTEIPAEINTQDDVDSFTGAEIIFQKWLEFDLWEYSVEILDIPDGESVELKQEWFHFKVTNK